MYVCMYVCMCPNLRICVNRPSPFPISSPYYNVVHFTVIRCTAPYCNVVHFTVIRCTAPYYNVVHFTVIRCTAPYYNVVHFTVIRCTAPYYNVVHFTVIRCFAPCRPYCQLALPQPVSRLTSTARPVTCTDPLDRSTAVAARTAYTHSITIAPGLVGSVMMCCDVL